MKTMRLLYPTLMMLTALFTACAYDDGYEEMTLTNDEAREIVDRCYYQCDSLDAVEIVLAIEEEYDIEIPDEVAETFTLVADLVKYVEEEI